MKATSLTYQNEMDGLLRRQSYAEITFQNIDVEAADDGEWECSDQEYYSEVNTLNYGFAYGDALATCELNKWVLDGSSAIIEDDASEVKDGYVSSSMSDENGHYTSNPILVRQFADKHTFRGVTMVFDSRISEHPVTVLTRFYLNGTLLEEVTTNPDGATCIAKTNAEEVDRVEIEFVSTLPYRRSRLQYTMFGVEVVFTNDDILNATQSNDVDPLTRRLPTETFTFTIHDYQHRYDPDNPQGEYIYIEENAPICIRYGYTLSDGSIEWLKPDWYLLDSKPTVRSSQATFSATGLLGRMNGTYYKSKIGEKTFYSMAEDVLRDANLSPTIYGTDPWEIDESLMTMTTTAVLPITTHANCLQMIAHACRCRLFTDDDNIIHIQPFGVTVKGIYSGEITDNGHTYYSEWYTTDTGNPSTNTYATLELNRWVLGGNEKSEQVIVADTNPDGRGYVSDRLSNSVGKFGEESDFEGVLFGIDESGHLIMFYPDGMSQPEFSISAEGHLIYSGDSNDSLEIKSDGHLYAESHAGTQPMFTKNFDKPHDVPVLQIRFDDALKEYPTQIRVLYYKGDSVIDTQVSDVQNYEATVKSGLAKKCTKFEVYFVSTLPNYRVRVAKLYFRETDFVLDFNSISEDSQVISKIDKLKAVSVAKYSYVAEVTSTDSGYVNVDNTEF